MELARRHLLIVTGALLALGLVMVYSASFVVAEQRFGSATFFLERQCVYLLAGCIALAVGSLWDYHALGRHWKIWLGLAVLILIAVLFPGIGERINGARRWFRIGSLTFQPSEAAKILCVLGIAGWAATRGEELRTFTRGFLPAALLAGVPVALVALEPDLGTAALLATVLCAMLFVAGVRLAYALPFLGIAAPAGALLAWEKLGYVRDRLEHFFTGEYDPLGRGYQVHQALIAQGSGGVWGAGLGQGHAKLLYLPEAHNDFILALIGEELGLIGSCLILLGFACLVWHGWTVARKAPDLLGSLLALGVTLMLGLQAAMNIAVVTRSMPTKGISLPLISYGGSALIFTLFGIGILLNVAAHPPAEEAPRALGAVARGSGRPLSARTA